MLDLGRSACVTNELVARIKADIQVPMAMVPKVFAAMYLMTAW